MGKKVTAGGQASKSHKIISKNNNHIHDNKKQRLNNLIKFLKPKVYITNSSNFKNLVQQLTGNGSSSPMISSPPPPDHHHDHDPRLQFINDHQYQEYSQELSIDSSKGSIPSSFNTFDQEPSFSLLDSNNYSNMGSQDQVDFSEEYRNIEIWLLEMDSYTSYHHQYEGHFPFIQEQVSVDDYSSLL